MTDNKKLPLVIGLAVVAVVVLLWSMKGTFGGGGSDKAPTGPPKDAMKQYSGHTNQQGRRQ